MEMEMNIDAGIALGETVDRLAATAASLEQTIERLEEKIAAAEQKLTALEARAEAGCPTSRRDVGSRKTLPTAMTTLLAKQGVSVDSLAPGTIEAGSLDAALSSLSLEQRFAVKAQLLRAGLLS
jgi:predicted RNase H-like nuclease (RuvC/YqgF family)